MFSLSYNISTQLRQNLLAIEKLRRSILLTPISTTDKRTLRFEAMTKRIYFGMSLSKEMSLTDLAYFLMLESTPTSKKHKDKNLRDHINTYKSTLNYVYQEWLVTGKPVEVKTIQEIGKLLGLRIRAEREQIASLLDYMETQYESPIIQSALALTQFPKLSIFSDKNTDVAHLMALLYLSKGAYDFRGFVVVDEELQKNKGEYEVMRSNALRTDNQTIWLEYYTGCFVRHLEHLQGRMTTMLVQAGWRSESPGEPTDPTVGDETIQRVAKLNRRQRNILTLVETPSATVTNKQVQDTFHVSQITASRDLSKLATLGLLVPHPRGRSTNYTKA